MSTFAAELARRGHRPWVSVEIAGLGRRLGATTAALRDAYRFCLTLPAGASDGSLHLDRLIPGLVDVPDSLSESIDVRGGTTDLGQVELQLLLASPLAAADHGWDADRPLLDMIGVRSPCSSWRLLQGVTAGATALHIVDTGADLPVVGQALWLGGETVVVDAIHDPCAFHANCVQLDVVRGTHGSTAVAHPGWSETPPGDGTAYDRPRSLRGRKVTLRVTFPDPEIEPVSGAYTLLPLSQEKVLFSGTLEDGDLPGPNVLRLQATSILSRMSRSIGRRQWISSISVFSRLADGESDPNAALPLEINHVVPSVESVALSPDYEAEVDPDGGYVRRFFARFADQIVRCLWRSVDETTGEGRLTIDRWGCLGTDPFSGLDGQRHQIWDVLLASPEPEPWLRDGDSHLSLCSLDGESTAHPVDLMLMLLTSAGDYTGDNGEWDQLSEHWGIAFPVSEIDLPAFRRLKEETAGLSFPNLVVGYEGKPVALDSLLEDEFLRPLGWFRFQDALGRLSVARIADAYPQASYVQLTEDDILHGSIALQLDLQSTVIAQDWAHSWNWGSGEFLAHTRFIPRETDQLVDDNSEESYELRGLDGDTAPTLIGQRARQLAFWFGSPIPKIKLSVQLDLLLDIEIGDIVLLSGVRWPDPLSPSSSTWERSALIVGRTVMLRGQPRLDLVLYPLPTGRTGLWAPAATVRSWNALSRQLTLEGNDFGDPDNDDPDAERFMKDDEVALISSRGAFRTDVSVKVTSSSGNVVTLAAQPSVGGGSYTPVAGDVLVYARWEDGAAPSASWTTRQRSYVAQADESTGLLTDGSTDPYTLGG